MKQRLFPQGEGRCSQKLMDMNAPALRLSVLAAGCAVSFWLGTMWRSKQGSLPTAPDSAATGKAHSPTVLKVTRETETTATTQTATSSTNRSKAEDRLAEILGSFDADHRQQELKRLGDELGRSSPETGWRLLASIGGLADREAFGEALAARWAAVAPEKALAACVTLTAGELRTSTLAAALGSWAENSPAQAAEWSATQLTGSARQLAVSRVAETWARLDPSAAAEWAVRQSASPAGTAAIEPVMSYWASTDPAAAAQWASSLAPGGFRQSALDALLTQWSDQFPQEAAAWTAVQPEAAQLALVVAGSWAKSDPQAAAQWALTLGTPDARSDASSIIAASWAAADPSAALAWTKSVTARSLRASLQGAAVQTWAAEDPAAALAWVQTNRGTLADPASAQEDILQTWATTAPERLAQWISTQSPGSNTDAAMRHLAIALAEVQPGQAADTALRMKESAARSSVFQQIYSQWKNTDPAAAQRWLAARPDASGLLAQP